MQRRIFLSPPRAGVSPEPFHRHWSEAHAAIFARTPGLRGYVQNRPLRGSWPRLRYQACSETWFDDRRGEAAAFGGEHYLDVVALDEETFIDREGSWSAPVTEEEILREGRAAGFRVLAFGAERDRIDTGACVAASVLRLKREPPGGGRAEVLSIWTDDGGEAEEIALGAGGLALVTAPAPILDPPAWPWSGAGSA